MVIRLSARVQFRLYYYCEKLWELLGSFNKFSYRKSCQQQALSSLRIKNFCYSQNSNSISVVFQLQPINVETKKFQNDQRYVDLCFSRLRTFQRKQVLGVITALIILCTKHVNLLFRLCVKIKAKRKEIGCKSCN